ncbi:MAG: penicillin-binding protein 2 [Chloroflexi bacterium]|nr:penicillin-binding protein 2 [Chloroflexota bacterium]
MPAQQRDAVRPNHLTWRHWLLATLMVAGFTALLVRLAIIQIGGHEQYLEEAAAARVGVAEVPASRGAILDATGYPLATSIDTWDVYIDTFLWRDRERARVAAAHLGAALRLNPEDLYALGTSRSIGDVPVLRLLEYEYGRDLREAGLWGVRLLPSSRRVYAEQELAGPIIGYVGLDGNGLWGGEADFDHVLRGRPGLVVGEEDPLGRPISFVQPTTHIPLSGGDVQLTIDRFIQAIAERELARAVEENAATGGTVIVMESRTGAILAMASLPTVRLATLDLDAEDLSDLVRNRSITDLYEPGSVFKTLTTAMAIDLGLVTPDSTYVDEGVMHVSGGTIRNWNFTAYGEVTMTEYLQRSLNTGAAWLSEQIGPRHFYEYLARFGVGERTHIGLSGEATGLIRRPTDDDWYPVDLATNSYGQGLAVTPLQTITAVNVFANNGALIRPQIVSQVATRDGVRRLQPVAVRQVVTSQTSQTVAQMMHDVVEKVPYHLARVEGYRVAGKTGTTLLSTAEGYDFDTTIATFAGFVPYEDPRITVLVKIDRPSADSHLGGVVAAPVFARIAGNVLDYLNVPITRPQVAVP